MTINQYQRLSKAIADRIIELGGNPHHVRHLTCNNTIKCEARDPHSEDELSITSGETNATLTFDVLSNPNNPNYKFRTLKPGSISAFDSIYQVNVDATKYNFDSAQFKKLIDVVKTTSWNLD